MSGDPNEVLHIATALKTALMFADASPALLAT